MKNTLVLGASLKEERISNRVIKLLRHHGIEVKAIGLRSGKVADIKIDTEYKNLKDIHTVTLYLNAENQKELEDYILNLNPKRIIFNPGAENPGLKIKAAEKGIEALNACNLVMLRLGQY